VVELAQVADDLYGLDPAEFTAARDERARRARAAGEKALGDAIKKLRRPTVSASLVNRLVRGAGDQVDRLLGLGESLREAQQTLASDELRRLSGQRRPVIRALAEEAKRLAAEAGRPVTDPVQREVEATLEAALADPAAAEAVRSGRLTVALTYAGFGGVDVADAVAVPAAGPVADGPAVASAPREWARQAGAEARRHAATPRRDQVAAADAGGKTEASRGERPKTAALKRQRQDAAAEQREAQDAARERREAETIARDVREAAAAARDAADDLDGAARRVAELRDARQGVKRRIEELEQRLAQAQAEEAEAARVLRDAERSRDAAARLAAEAQRRFARVQARAEASLKASSSRLPRSG
jgi:hypothetical protein